MKRAIVIGATSGIGRGLAEELAARGYRVGLVGRREALLREIAAADPAAYSCAVADVTQPDAALAALDGLVAVLGGLELCIVAAGTGDLNPDLDFAVEASAIRTNILGWTAVVDWACRLFERQRGGHLVVISSVGGLRGSGAAPAYNASKAYQINYAEGLRQRAAKSGLPLPVTDIRPGFVATALLRNADYPMLMRPEKVAEKLFRALERSKRRVVIDRRYALLVRLWRLIPQGVWERLPIRSRD